MAPADRQLRTGPYEPIDVNRARHSTAEERREVLSETLLWGWSGLVVLGAAYGIHEILAQGTWSFGYMVAGLVAAVLIGATEYHIVCNVIASARGRPQPSVLMATALCLGFLFIFAHVGVVSALGTPKLAYDAWLRSVTSAGKDISAGLEEIETGLEHLIASQYELRGEEEPVGSGTPAPDGNARVSPTGTGSAFAAMAGRWSDGFSTGVVPLRTALDDLLRDDEPQTTEAAQSAAGDVARALAAFTADVRSQAAATGFSRYLDTPELLGDPAAEQYLQTIATGLATLSQVPIAPLSLDRSAGIAALRRLGGAIAGLFGAGPAAAGPLKTRDHIGLGASALALLFVLLLQVNRWRFRVSHLPAPPGDLEMRDHRVLGEP